MEEMKPREPELVQRVMGVSGQDETADYITACRDKFRDCLRSVFINVAQMAFIREADITGKVMPEATGCYQDYFKSMKGQTNFTEEDLGSLIDKEEKRQQKFYQALRELSDRFSHDGIIFDILRPGDIYCEPSWDTGFTVGTSIRTEEGAFLFSSPLVPAHTADYMALRQEPVAANILNICKEYILFLPNNQDPGEKFGEVCLKIFGPPRDVTEEFAGAWSATLMNGFLLMDSDKAFSAAEIEVLRKKYGVNVVVTADSSQFTASIRVEEDKELSRLLEEIGRKEPY